MKKIFYLFILVLSLLVLVGCNNNEDNNEVPIVSEGDSTIVISKLYTSTSVKNNVIELYNNSNKDVNLGNYSIFYHASASEDPTAYLDLEGIIKANSFFAIGGKDVDLSEYGFASRSFNFINKDGNLMFDGDDAVVLTRDDIEIDVVGFKNSLGIMYSRGLTLIRLGELKDFAPTTEFDIFNFIQYVPDAFQYLKKDTYKIKTLEDLYAGPRLDNKYKIMPYASGNLGTGGAAKVTSIVSVADGDTATFNYPNKPNGMSHRYYYIDTPEIDSEKVTAEPWGYVASEYNKKYILNQLNNYADRELYVQSIPNYALTETYGRNIGLVWINDSLSQFLTVSEGLSIDVPVSYDNIDVLMDWQDVPYLTFLRFAEKRAKDNGWGLKGFPGNPNGDKAPDWDFSTGTKITNYTWEPHLPMPWDK